MKKPYLAVIFLFLCGCEKVVTPPLPDLNKEYINYDDVMEQQQELEKTVEQIVQ